VNRVFYAWALQRSVLKEPHIIHENVEDFGMDMMVALLGRWYVWSRIVLTPVELGWSTRRTRQFLHGTLRGLRIPFVRELGCGSMEEIIKAFMYRQCTFTQMEYCIASEAELEAELTWAKSRQKALACSSTVPNQGIVFRGARLCNLIGFPASGFLVNGAGRWRDACWVQVCVCVCVHVWFCVVMQRDS